MLTLARGRVVFAAMRFTLNSATASSFDATPCNIQVRLPWLDCACEGSQDNERVARDAGSFV